jgi:hypothetical protein
MEWKIRNRTSNTEAGIQAREPSSGATNTRYSFAFGYLGDKYFDFEYPQFYPKSDLFTELLLADEINCTPPKPTEVLEVPREQ